MFVRLVSSFKMGIERLLLGGVAGNLAHALVEFIGSASDGLLFVVTTASAVQSFFAWQHQIWMTNY